MMKVQILSRKLIKRATPTPPHLRSYKISPIDQLAPTFYVRTILYYLANGDENDDGRRKRLEKSLSEILTLYCPLAGRYIKDDQLVDCNDEGVEYLEAQSACFECGGLAIGLIFSHIIADGIAATTFLNAWATACKVAGINNNEIVVGKFQCYN
ncbi:acetyl-CoA-benzylalcohol acetyltransferase-like [Fagus crenata]